MALFATKETFEKTGFCMGMTDWHSHLIPGVDDGIKTMEDSLRVLLYYETLGVKEVWCTPHVYEDLPNETILLKERFEELRQAYRGSIKLHLAAEYMMDHEFASRLEKKDLLPLGEDGDELLVETSFFNGPEHMEETFKRIMSRGYYPVLAHPERYIYMGTDDYKKWKQMGIRFQLNITSLADFYGSNVRHKAEWLLKHSMYERYGTDVHNANKIAGEKTNLGLMSINSKMKKHLNSLKCLQ